MNSNNSMLRGSFHEFDTVRVLRLVHDRARSLWDGSLREPQVGDIGSVVEVHRTPLASPRFTIECVAADGRTVRMAEFGSDELELVGRP
jgi:hypothetical protein